MRTKAILLPATLLAAWLGMQQLHELGHVLGAQLTGGHVQQVALPLFGFSRTDLSRNPRPLAVAWAGPIFGALAPLLMWFAADRLKFSGAFVLRFLAGFCLLANGLYLGVGSFDRVGDCGDLLRHGAPIWHLWLFGLATAPLGLGLWHGLGPKFGLGRQPQEVPRAVAYGTALTAMVLLVIAVVVTA
jgi:hypothetical protein